MTRFEAKAKCKTEVERAIGQYVRWLADENCIDENQSVEVWIEMDAEGGKNDKEGVWSDVNVDVTERVNLGL